MRKLIFSIITLLGLSATAELSAQFLSADLQADDLRGNVAKVEYPDIGTSIHGLMSVIEFYYDNNGYLYSFGNLPEYAKPTLIRNSNNKIQEIILCDGDEGVHFKYNGDRIAEVERWSTMGSSTHKTFYNQNGNLIREEAHWWSEGEEGTTIVQYTILERDSKGNWIKRSVKRTNKWGTETQIETRKITYR